MKATNQILVLITFTLCCKIAMTQQNTKCVIDSSGVFNKVDTEAKFPGGNKELRNYLQNIDLSELNFEQSKIEICLIIDSIGQVIPYTLNGKNVSTGNLTALEQSYLKSLISMPRWEPATCGNRKISSYYHISQYIDVK